MVFSEPNVLRLVDIDRDQLSCLWAGYGLELGHIAPDAAIPGSFWGESEAGLVEHKLYVRDDTPVHSILHEGGHFVCMDQSRRNGLNTDAGGDYDEENGVCYLQILLAGLLPGVGRERMFVDMDTWGYTFRLGSTKAWFQEDAEDAQTWLQQHGIIDTQCALTGRIR